jgi:hypothetical protein
MRGVMGINRNLAIGVVAAVALLYGCSRSPPGTSGGVASGSIAAKKPVKPGDGLVSAVPANKTPLLPLQVRFELHQRPDVGQPVEVDLVFQPTSNMVDRIFGKVEAEDGLELVEGAQIGPIVRPVEGVAVRHAIKLLPKRDGIFTFNATLSVESGVDTSTQTYSMPVIAGSGLPAPPAKAQSPQPPAAATTAAVRPPAAATAPAR